MTVFESAPLEKIASFSTSQLAPILDAAQKRFRLIWIAALVALLSILAAVQGNAWYLPIALVFGLIVTCVAAMLDRYRRSVKIEFKFEGLAGNVTTALLGAFDDLCRCGSVWNVTQEEHTSDWKRNAGATTLNIRRAIRPRLSRPNCIRSRSRFPSLSAGRTDLYFFPDGILVVTKTSVTALAYNDVTVAARSIRFIEDGTLPSDTTIVDETWRYVNKNGGPDRRFNSNRRLPICRYGELDFQSDGGLNNRVQYSNAEAGDRLVKVIDLLRQLAAARGRIDTAFSYREPRGGPTAVFCGVLLVGGLLMFLPVLRSAEVGIAQKPTSAVAEQPVSAIPLPRPRPMGGPFVDGIAPKQTKTPRADSPNAIGSQPLQINPLDSQPLSRPRNP